MQFRTAGIALCGSLLFVAPWMAPVAHAQGKPRKVIAIAVIVHPTERESNISLDGLQMLFLKLKQSWAGHGSMIILNWEAKTPIRVAFDRQAAKMNPEQIATYWLDRRIRGHGMPPRALTSSLLLQRIVLSQKDAIAYVRVDEIQEKVKVLKINGKRPGEAGYPLLLELEP
jgi:hypothetical protein